MPALTTRQVAQLERVIPNAIRHKNENDQDQSFAFQAGRREVVGAVIQDLAAAGCVSSPTEGAA
jgi:hypothetical protein